MRWRTLGSSVDLRAWLYEEALGGPPPALFLTESREGQDGYWRELFGHFFLSRNEVVFRPGGIEVVIPLAYNPVESADLAATVRRDVLNGINHLEYRSFDEDYRYSLVLEGEGSDTETLLDGLPSVGPGGHVRVTRMPHTFRVTASTRVIAGSARTEWVPAEVLEARLAAASSLIDQDGVTLRAAYGYHELSLYASQGAIEAAVVMVAEHMGRPTWRTVFVQAVSERLNGDTLGWTGASPGARPPRFDNCQ